MRLAIASLALIVHEASAKVVIIQATGPSAEKFPKGKIFDRLPTVNLVSGDRLTVLDETGTRVFVGPVKLKEQHRQPTEPRSAALAKLFEDNRMARTAGTRTTSSTVVSGAASERRDRSIGANLWAVDVTAGGAWCIRDVDSLELWRPNADKKDAALLVSSSGATTSTGWAKGDHFAFWPQETTIVSGETYQIQYAKEQVRLVTLHLIEADESDLLTMGKKLLDNGCHDQLDMLDISK